MSSIAVQGGATGTGTVSILAPSTSTNRTLTLPDSTGTIAAASSGTADATTFLRGDGAWSVVEGIPAGSVIWYAANAAPTGFLKANGATISRSTYASLFSAIGTTFGAGDGSTTFLVPDLRGEFLRGWDDGRGIDSGRAFGSAQGQAIQSHQHNLNYYTSAPNSSGFGYATGANYGGETADGFRQTQVTGGSETRPRNIALLACIKF